MTQKSSSSCGASGLLHCLSQLKDDVFVEVLLPKLIQQGSAGDVALACSQLRDLCFHSVYCLNLSELAGKEDLTMLEDWVAPLPQHFISCRKIRLCLRHADHYHVMPFVLPALSRLAKLGKLNLTFKEHLSTAAPLCSLLCLVRTQLTSLQCLILDFRRASAFWEQCSVVRQLARMTSLTRLALYGGKDGPATTLRDLLELSALTGLQKLTLKVTGLSDSPDPQQPGLPHGLTALTCVRLYPCQVAELCYLNSCVMLESVFLQCAADDMRELDPDHWACIAPLTRLTELQLYNSVQLEACPARHSVLQQLPRLQVLWAWEWHRDALADLTSCTALRELGGTYLREGAALLPPSVTLPMITYLYWVSGAMPFEALPNVRELYQYAPMDVGAWLQLSKHCPAIKKLTVHAYVGRKFSIFSDGVDPGLRLDAIRALTSLTALTRLDFAPTDVDEIVALLTAASSLAAMGLQELSIFLHRRTDDSLGLVESALVQLARCHSLRTLHLYLNDDSLFLVIAQIKLVLCAAWGVHHLVISCKTEAQRVLITVAMESLQQLNLPRPGSVQLKLWK